MLPNPDLILCVSVAGVAALLSGVLPRVRATTLVATVGWAVAAMSAQGVVALRQILFAATQTSETENQAWLYAAATLTLCPHMSVLGAKRPQDRGWQFIVFSLWLVLVLPAFEAAFLWRGGVFELSGARSWFLAVLILVQTSNYIATRFWDATCALCIAQIVLLRPYLPLVRSASGNYDLFVATTLGLVAILIVAGKLRGISVGVAVPATGTLTAALVNQRWRDFRDLFGAIWALRVMERVNLTRDVAARKLSLGWSGIESPANPDAERSELPALTRTMWTILRRFMPDGWLGSSDD